MNAREQAYHACMDWYGLGREPQEVCVCGHYAASHSFDICARCDGFEPAREEQAAYDLPPGMTEAALLRGVLRQVLDKADPDTPCGHPTAAETFRAAARVLTWARDGHGGIPNSHKAAWRAGYDEAARAVLKALRPADDIEGAA